MPLTPNNREEHWLQGMVDGQTDLEPNKRREYWYKEIVDAIGSGGGGGGGGVSLVNYDDYIVATDGTKAVLGDSIYVTIDGQVENISFYDEIPMVADISLGSPVIYKTDEGEYKLMNYKVDTTEYGAAEVVPLQSGFYLNNDITDCIMLVDMESGNNFAIIFPPTATFTYNLGH